MEVWDAYTRDEVRTGEKLVRGAPIPDGVYHLVSEILVCHVDGDFLLMQRDPAPSSRIRAIGRRRLAARHWLGKDR